MKLYLMYPVLLFLIAVEYFTGSKRVGRWFEDLLDWTQPKRI